MSKFNPYGTTVKRNGCAGSAQKNGHMNKHLSKEREHKGTNFPWIIIKEVKQKCSTSSLTSARNIM